MNLAPSSRFAAQFHRWLEEIHIEPNRSIQLSELPVGGFPNEAVVPNQLPNDGAVLLLDEALVIGLRHPPAGECDLFAGAIGQHGRVNEFAAIVRIQPKQRERQQPAGVS